MGQIICLKLPSLCPFEFFSDDVGATEGDDTDHPILDDLNRLTNIDAKIRMFLDFGKRNKKEKKAAASRKSPRAGTAGAESQDTVRVSY